MTSYSEYVDYFRTLAAAHSKLKQFVVGGSERILNRNRTTIEYPILWLEVPEVSMSRGGSETEYSAIFSGAFLVLENAQPDNWEREDADLNNTLNICMQILARMESDADADEWSISLDNINIEHKGRWGDDNDWGWRVNFEISMPVGCLDESAFTDD
jgi:hypothetical protein